MNYINEYIDLSYLTQLTFFGGMNPGNLKLLILLIGGTEIFNDNCLSKNVMKPK